MEMRRYAVHRAIFHGRDDIFGNFLGLPSQRMRKFLCSR
jgi:hypothetical protein